MKNLLITLLLALPLAVGGAFAQDKKAEPKKEEKKEMSPQHLRKIAECSAAFQALKGDEHKKKHAECMAK